MSMYAVRAAAHDCLAAFYRARQAIDEVIPKGTRVKCYGSWTGVVHCHVEPFCGEVGILVDAGQEGLVAVNSRYGTATAHVDNIEIIREEKS